MDLTVHARFRREATSNARQLEGEDTEDHSIQHSIPVVVPPHQGEGRPVPTEGHQVPPAPLDLPMTESPPISPIQDQPPVSQSAHAENEQEHVDLARHHTQDTVPPDQVTPSVIRSPSVITSESQDPRSMLPRNSDEQITEVPRQQESAALVRMLRLS